MTAGFADWISGQAKAGAAVAAVMAGVSAYGYTEVNKLHKTEIERLAAEHGAAVADLERGHEDALREARRAHEAELDRLTDAHEATVGGLEDALQAAKAEGRLAIEREVLAKSETLLAKEREVAQIRQLLSLYGKNEQGRAQFDLRRMLVATRDDEALDPMVDEFFGGRVLALAAADDRMQASLPAGSNARLMTDESFDLMSAMKRDHDGPVESLWLLGPVQPIEGHRFYRRAAPFVTVRRYSRDEVGEGSSEAWVDDKPDVGLFFRAFNGKIAFANDRDVRLQMNVRRLEQVGRVHFAHFRTKLRHVTIGGVNRKRVFLHEILMTAPTAEGVFEVNAAFLSPRASYVSSPHWPAVAEWFMRLRILAT